MRKAQQAANPLLMTEQKEPFVPSKGWAEIIRKVYEVDPLFCPSCGSQMRVIAFIEEPKVIDKIIRHLKLSFITERPPPPQIGRHELFMAAEDREEYFQGNYSLHFVDLVSIWGKESILLLIVLQLMTICLAYLPLYISF